MQNQNDKGLYQSKFHYELNANKYSAKELDEFAHYIDLIKELDSCNHITDNTKIDMGKHRAIQIFDELVGYPYLFSDFDNTQSMMFVLNYSLYQSLYYGDPSDDFNRFDGELNYDISQGMSYENFLQDASKIAKKIIKEYLLQCVPYAKR